MVDVTHMTTDLKIKVIQRALDITEEEAKYIVDLREIMQANVNTSSGWWLRLSLYAMGVMAGQIAEAMVAHVAEDNNIPKKWKVDARKMVMQAFDGAFEESIKARREHGGKLN